MSFEVGCIAGWPSAAVLILKSENSPLPSGPITDEEISWIYALPPVGAVTANFLYGSICSKYGRKIPLFSAAVPLAV